MSRIITEADLDLAAELTIRALETVLEYGEIDPDLGDPIDGDEARRIGLAFFERNRSAMLSSSVGFVTNFAQGLIFPNRLEQFTMMIRGYSPPQLADLAEADADEAEKVVREARERQEEMIEDVRSTASILIKRAIALGLMVALRETKGTLPI